MQGFRITTLILCREIAIQEELFQREFNPKDTLTVLQANIGVFWSWGVSRGAIFPSSTQKGEAKGILLKVNGAYFKEYVLITLGYDDTYTVSYLKKVPKGFKIRKKVTGLYFDDLVESIDGHIESGTIKFK